MIKNIDKIVIKQTILAMDRHLENFNRKSHVHLKLIGMYFRKKKLYSPDSKKHVDVKVPTFLWSRLQ